SEVQAGERINSTSAFLPLLKNAVFKSSAITSIAGQPEYVGVSFIYTTSFFSIASLITPTSRTLITGISGSGTDSKIDIRCGCMLGLSITVIVHYIFQSPI